jgi:hypothetical protein
MSSKRYIQLVSTNRDRTQYPTIGDFVTPISGSNSCGGVAGSADPVATSAPIYIFQKGSLNHAGQFNGGDYINPGLDVTVANPFVPTGTGNGMYRAFITPESFKGYMLLDKDGFSGNASSSSTGTNRIITSYYPPDASVSLDFAEPSSFYTTTNYYTVADYSGVQSATGSNFPNYNPIYDFTKLFCPQPFDVFGKKCPIYSDAFAGYYMKIEPTAGSTYPGTESRKIVKFDVNKRLIEIDQPFTQLLPSADINVNDIISIRESISTPQIQVNNTFLQSFMITNTPATTTGSYTLSTIGATSIANGGSKYVGNYIYIVPRATDPVLRVRYPILTEPALFQDLYYFRILAYNADNTFTVDKPFNVAFYGGNLNNRNIEILAITRDNFVPLEYNGTMVSQNETVCYEIALTFLSLPNVDLAAGSRIAFYPYVYVLLENATEPSGLVRGVFYSNNPNTHKALFVAPITDTSDPENTPYVRVNGFGITQTVKFKPNDALHFKVFLPDGSPFQPLDADNPPPLPPNKYLQVSAVFSIKRVA